MKFIDYLYLQIVNIMRYYNIYFVLYRGGVNIISEISRTIWVFGVFTPGTLFTTIL